MPCDNCDSTEIEDYYWEAIGKQGFLGKVATCGDCGDRYIAGEPIDERCIECGSDGPFDEAEMGIYSCPECEAKMTYKALLLGQIGRQAEQ